MVTLYDQEAADSILLRHILVKLHIIFVGMMFS